MNNLVIDLPEDVALLVLIMAVAATVLVSLWSWRAIVPVILVTGIIEMHLSINPVVLLYGYNVLPIDVLFVGILVTYIIRLGILGRIGTTQLCWLGLAGLMALSLLRGISAFGLNTAVVTFRQEFYFLVGALYMQSFYWSPRDLEYMVAVWLVCAGTLVAYCVLCWLDPSFVVLQSDPLYVFSNNPSYLGWRVLPAASTMLIAQAGLVAALLWLRNDRTGVIHIAAVPLLLSVVLLYHRSVWVASLAGTGALILYNPRLLDRLMLPLAVSAVGFISVLALGGDGVSGALQSAVAEPFSDSSTWGWRVNNWENMIPETLAAGPLTVLLGWGYGVNFVDLATGVALVNPHNAYVAFFLNTGLLGSGMMMICCAMPIWRFWRGNFQASRSFDRHTAIALSVMMVVYYVPYSVSVDHGIVLGILAALGAQCQATPWRHPTSKMAPAVRVGAYR